MSPALSQLALWTVVLGPIAFGIWLDRRMARANEDARALAQIRAAKAPHDEATAPTAKSTPPLRDNYVSEGL